MIITIDGPAGSGKSSLAHQLAQALHLRHLNSGLLYRACAKILLDNFIITTEQTTDFNPSAEQLAALNQLEIQPEEGEFKVFVDGKDLSCSLNQTKLDRLTALIAGTALVRQKVVSLQRAAAKMGGLVIDGRDCGTMVFPDADLKIFLTANIETRVRRIAQRNFGNTVTANQLEALEEKVSERDRQDATREASPLLAAKDAIIVDNTKLTLKETLQLALDHLTRLRLEA